MRVAASSPAWLTRSAEERKSRCDWVSGLRLLVVSELVEEPCWDLDEGVAGALFEVWGWTSAGRVGVVESRRREELGEQSAGTRKCGSGACRDMASARCAEKQALVEGDILTIIV